MSETRVVHVKDNVEGAIYIGRSMPNRSNPNRRLKASPFANPFKIGDTLPTFEGLYDRVATREDVVHQYALWILKKPDLINRLPELRGKPLACWCRHDGDPVEKEFNKRVAKNGCHGDVLIDLLNEYSDEELKSWQ